MFKFFFLHPSSVRAISYKNTEGGRGNWMHFLAAEPNQDCHFAFFETECKKFNIFGLYSMLKKKGTI